MHTSQSHDKRISYGSMFSGIDAPYHALKTLGNDIKVDYRFAIENNLKVVEILKRNARPGLLLQSGVQDFQLSLLPRVDIFVCSPPCQSFSKLGRRDPMDPRRSLWKFGIEYISLKKPDFAIFENVPGFATAEFPALESCLPDGYHCFHRLLNARDFGSLQNRPRHFIVLRRTPTMHWPMKRRANLQLRTILQSVVPSKYYYSERGKAYLQRRRKWGANVLSQESTIVPCFCRSFGNQSVHWKHTFNDKGSLRRLTPVEIMRLFGFSDDFDIHGFSDRQIYFALGNSMDVGMMRALFKALLFPPAFSDD